MTKIKKAPFIGSSYEGDTLLDIHGYDNEFEEIYISGTDINVTEMIHSLTAKSFTQFEFDATSYFYSKKV